jgi:hypothetical protein
MEIELAIDLIERAWDHWDGVLFEPLGIGKNGRVFRNECRGVVSL